MTSRGGAFTEGPGAEGEGGTPCWGVGVEWGVGGCLVAGVGGGRKVQGFLRTLQSGKLTCRSSPPPRTDGREGRALGR